MPHFYFYSPLYTPLIPHFTLLKLFSCLFLPLDCILHGNTCYFLIYKILQTYIAYPHTHHLALAFCSICYRSLRNTWHSWSTLFIPPTQENFYPKFDIYHFYLSLHTFVTYICMHKYYHVARFPKLFKRYIVHIFMQLAFITQCYLIFIHVDTYNSKFILTAVFFCIYLYIFKLSIPLLMNILVISNFSVTIPQ